MTENYCIFCKHKQTKGFDNKTGTFKQYCQIHNKSTSTISIACEKFEKKEKQKDWEITEITVKKPSLIHRILDRIV